MILVPAEYSPLAIRTQSAALATATNCTNPNLIIPIMSRTNITHRDLYLPGGRNHPRQHCQHWIPYLHLLCRYVKSSPPQDHLLTDHIQSLTFASCLSSTSSTQRLATSPWSRSTNSLPVEKSNFTGSHLWVWLAMSMHESCRAKRWKHPAPLLNTLSNLYI